MCQVLFWVQENIYEQSVILHGAYILLGETESNQIITYIYDYKQCPAGKSGVL